MKRILKYKLEPGGRMVRTLELPTGARVLHSNFQADVQNPRLADLYLWALVNVDDTPNPSCRSFRVYNTGERITSDPGIYISTAHHGGHVAHIFEVANNPQIIDQVSTGLTDGTLKFQPRNREPMPYFVAPAICPTDIHAGGGDANEFATRAEALAAIPKMGELGPEYECCGWVVSVRHGYDEATGAQQEAR